MPISTAKPFKLKQAAIRMVTAPPLHSEEPITSPESAIQIMASELKNFDREVMCVINLKQNGQPINFNIASMGALNESIVHPRELMKSIILSNAASVILVHNHPSGSLVPSREDIMLTDRMQQVCELVGVKVLDHVIIGGGNDRDYYSFMERGVLPVSKIRFTTSVDDLKWDRPVAAEGSNPYHRESLVKQLKETRVSGSNRQNSTSARKKPSKEVR